MSTPIATVISEEIGQPIIFWGIAIEILSQRNSLIDSEIKSEPTKTIVSEPKTNTTILEQLSHE